MTVREEKTPAGRRLFRIEDNSGHENHQKMLLDEDEARDLHRKLTATFQTTEAGTHVDL